MTMQLGVFICSLLGFSCLMLSMQKHFQQLTQLTLGNSTSRVLRIAGWLFLLAAVWMAMQAWQSDVGFVNWLGWLSVAGLVITFSLSYWPWQAKATTKSMKTSKLPPKKVAAPVKSSLSIKAVVPAVLMLAVLTSVSWHFYETPVKPLLRDDVFEGTVGPWSFALAERETKAPEVEALNLGVKQFVIRFCESCNAEISTAYFKVRQPRSLRTAGNAFFAPRGSDGRERFVEIAIPPAATLADGLWLTVVSKQGEQFETQLDIERISPKMAEFIRNQS